MQHKKGSEVFVVCAQIEQEISELDDEEKKMFLEDLGLSESGLEKLIRASDHLLGLMSFLTSRRGDQELSTDDQTGHEGTAGGRQDSHRLRTRLYTRLRLSITKICWKTSSLAAASEKGLVRMEGKEYVVQDGDVIPFRFNV